MPLINPFTIGLAALLPFLYTIDKTWAPRQHVFDPVKLQAIAKNAIAVHANNNNTTELFKYIHSNLRAEYGDAIVPSYSDDDWFFNNAGGAMGSMVYLHASITEYLIFFGTATQTEGHSGVHLADDYFTILVGEQYTAYAHSHDPIIYRPGDQNHLTRGDAIQYSMPEKCFALELAQGWIPAMVPFGLADTFTSTLDWYNLWKTLKLTGLRMGEQLARGKF